MPCYKYKFQYLPAMPCLCPVIRTSLLPELVHIIFQYAFQMDTLEGHHSAVHLLHKHMRSINTLVADSKRQHAMWRNCTKHNISWEEMMHGTTLKLLDRAADFLYRALRNMPDPVKVIYRTPVIYAADPNAVAETNGPPVLPEMVNYF